MDPSVILGDLNEAQKAAVTSPEPVVQILAPPGSGKTKTLTARVAYLLHHYSYAPWNIICVTFTIKSAREMKERIAKLIGSGRESKLILGTFHSVCRRYLVSYGSRIGIPKGFGIADTSDSQAIIGRIVKRLKLNIDPKAARSRISSSKARCIGYEKLRAEALKNKKTNVDQHEFITVFEEYQLHLETSNLLDYDDLLLRCVELLQKHPECVSNVEAVLIDEFQDTNKVQYQLMNLLAAKNKRITTVGDPDQSIYGWRSAEIKNLTRMQTLYPDTLIINLENNYRSAGSILKVALEVIEQDESRPAKPLLSTHCRGTIPTFRRLPKAADEASWMVDEVKRCVWLCGGNLLKYSDFAILLRSAALSRQIESAFGKAGIPYRMVGGLRFFDRVEVKILLDYMRVINQPENSDAFSRIMNIPARGVGDTTIRALLAEALSRKITLYSFVQGIIQGTVKPTTKVTKGIEQGLSTLYNLVTTLRNKFIEEGQSPQVLLDNVLRRLQFKTYLERKYPEDHENRWANVEELMAQAEDTSFMSEETDETNEDALPQIEGLEQDSSNKASEALTKFLANVALATEIQRDDDISDETGVPIERVTISTIHAAKGLEWPVVFIPAAYEGSIPHSRAEDWDEERRLLYVAMTRAKALLYISCPMKKTGSEETTISPFLSTKKVMKRLAGQGPCLRTNQVVPDIARILGRACPTQEAMNEGIGKIARIEDDFWPLDGTINAEAIVERGLGRVSSWNDGTSRYNKRRKVSGDAEDQAPAGWATARNTFSSYETTMQRTSSFTMPPNTGFTSAASELANQNMQSKSSEFTKKPNKDLNPSKKTKLVGAKGHGTLTALWQGQKREVIPTSANVGRQCMKQGITKQSLVADDEKPEQDVQLPPVRADRVPMSGVPASFTNHSLRPFSFSRPKLKPDYDEPGTENRYMFLSSSPSKSEAHKRDSATAKVEMNPPIVAPNDSAIRNTVRSSTTFHTTSMDELRNRNRIMPQKTLGVRRSVVGWNGSGKASRPFSVPRPGGSGTGN